MGFVSCHPAAISCRLGLQIPLLWLLHEVNWHMVLAAPSLTESSQGRPHGSCAPKTLIGKKDERKGAEVLVLYGLDAEEPSAGCGECSPRSSARAGELSTLLFPLPHFPGWDWGTLESPPSLGCVFEGYWKSTYLGQELRLASMAMVVGSEWVSRDREYLRIRDTQTPVWSRRSLLLYQHISPKERQEIIWETEDHI